MKAAYQEILSDVLNEDIFQITPSLLNKISNPAAKDLIDNFLRYNTQAKIKQIENKYNMHLDNIAYVTIDPKSHTVDDYIKEILHKATEA